jgi:hypothetical protein
VTGYCSILFNYSSVSQPVRCDIFNLNEFQHFSMSLIYAAIR